MDQFSCILYIDTNEVIDAVKGAVYESGKNIFSGMNVSLLVYNNEDFDPSRLNKKPYDFIEASKYYVEIVAEDELDEQVMGFQLGVVALIRQIRSGGRIVTASCDFEDLIISETGWNWTESQPEPPEKAQ